MLCHVSYYYMLLHVKDYVMCKKKNQLSIRISFRFVATTQKKKSTRRRHSSYKNKKKSIYTRSTATIKRKHFLFSPNLLNLLQFFFFFFFCLFVSKTFSDLNKLHIYFLFQQLFEIFAGEGNREEYCKRK